MWSKKRRATSAPGRPLQRPAAGRFTQAAAQFGIVRPGVAWRRPARDVAGLDQQPFALVLRQVRQVAGPPADNRQSERHRFAVHRSVRLLQTRQHEDVGRRVEAPPPPPSSVARAPPPVPVRSAGRAGPDARGVRRLGSIVADQVQRHGRRRAAARTPRARLSTPLRSTQLPTHRKAAASPAPQVAGRHAGLAATSRPGGTTTMRSCGVADARRRSSPASRWRPSTQRVAL